MWRKTERRRRVCGVLHEDEDGKIVLPYQQKIDSFVEKAKPQVFKFTLVV